METKRSLNKEDVLKANVELHTQLAKVYNKDEPHWRPENVQQVRSRLKDIKQKIGGSRMLDVGCGTGFMVEVARPLDFDYIFGIDITPAMLNQVDKTGIKKIDLVVGDASKIPANESSFDVATAYSFIDHLYDMESVFREVSRCLKPGGIFYAGLIPNEFFWSSITELDRKNQYSKAITREIRHVAEKDTEISQTYGVDQQTFIAAEFQKNVKGGLSEENLRSSLTKSGFSEVHFVYDWFLGQGLINNDQALAPEKRESRMSVINSYLQDNLPITKNLFKYLSFFATK